jgi:hypothetical protein
MANLMNEMILEASKDAASHGYGFSHREVEAGKLSCRVLTVNTNSMIGAQKTWKLNGKKIAASKVLAL